MKTRKQSNGLLQRGPAGQVLGGRGVAQLIRRHPLVTFFLLAFGITWIVWVPRAAGVQVGVVGDAWTWTPAIAALLAAALTGGAAAGGGAKGGPRARRRTV